MADHPPPIHFPFDDCGDLDDAELWAVIDSAAAASTRPRRPLLPAPRAHTSPVPPRVPHRNPRTNGSSPDGEVVQERPPKAARLASDSGCGDPGRMVVVRRPQQSPRVAFPQSPPPCEARGLQVQEVQVGADLWLGDRREGDARHCLSGQFPSVAMFKQYQNAAMAVLEKSDYTMISGNPFIKKSGWRKISFFFNLSFEIKDKSIEFDDNRNVLRAEFVVRAFMQSGRFADGWGSCERREKRFMKPNHDIPSTAETRAKNRACQDLIGIGEYRPGLSNTVH